MKKKLARSYHQTKHSTKRRFKKHPYLFPVLGVVLGCLLVGGLVLASGGKSYRPSDSHVVNLFVDDENKVVPSRATTVGDVLKEQAVKLQPEDVVEPSADTPIVEDNFRVNVYRARPVTVVDGNTKTVILSAQKSPRVVAQQANVSVYPEDKIVFEQGSLREDVLTEKVVIDRSVPIMFNLYGLSVTIRTHSKTVGQLLAEKQIKLAQGDIAQPVPETPLTPNMQVFVIRNGTQIAAVTEAIAPPTQTIEDASLSFGTVVVRQPGTPGKRAVTYQIQTQNGVEVSRVKIQEAVVQDPVTQIVARGKAVSIPADKSSIMAAAGISSSDYAYVNYIISRESGWCPTKWQGQAGYCPPYYQEIHSPSAGYGYGLCQSTPAIKMSTAGADWQTNPVTQLKWCSGYAHSRYGGWAGAYNRWVTHHNW